MRRFLRTCVSFVALSILSAPASAAVIVYQNDFNAPSGFVTGSYTDVSQQTVNSLYGAGFDQTNTVETIRIAGSALYSDPSGTGGAYALGMLASAQDDKLSLSFNVGALSFVNVQVDISSIDLVGPFAPFNGTDPAPAPTFDLTLYDSPGGTFDFNAPGTALDSASIMGTSSSLFVFDWTNHISALSTSGNTDGNVTLLFDLKTEPDVGYAAFDNLIIASSDTEDDVGGGFNSIPEPSAMILFATGLLGTFAATRRRKIG